jgi:hypothetical protein
VLIEVVVREGEVVREEVVVLVEVDSVEGDDVVLIVDGIGVIELEEKVLVTSKEIAVPLGGVVK